MAGSVNPRRLRPADLLWLLNAAGQGTVLTEAQLRRHRNAAGYTIGDARTVDLFRYAAWLTLEYFNPKAEALSYDEQKARQAQRNAEAVRSGQEIGELPAVVNPARKAAGEESFRVFCESTDVVYQFCRQSSHAGILLPSHGKYVGASGVPFSEYKRKRGDRVGLHWRIPNTTGRRQVRHVLVDSNYWKSFVQARMAVAMGDPGCLSLFGRDEKRHRLLADHLTAEYRIKTVARERTVDEWKLRATRPDNHWLDCLVGCAVAATSRGRHWRACHPGRREPGSGSSFPTCSGGADELGKPTQTRNAACRSGMSPLRMPALSDCLHPAAQ